MSFDIPKRADSALHKHFAKAYIYPCGVVDIIASSAPDFAPDGWEDASKHPKQGPKAKRDTAEAKAEDVERSMRRARARVRRLALANDFRWFVTLTLDPQKIDRYDPNAVIKRLNQWCSNQVKRKGLSYILVPEKHKDGALHFHGFFNDALEAVDSGHRSKSGQPIYNLPGWDYGFTAAIEVYGDYAAAVAYVSKYIGKQGEKPGGRWYYSGGSLREPAATYLEMSPVDLVEEYGDKCYCVDVPGRRLAIVNGLKEENNGG